MNTAPTPPDPSKEATTPDPTADLRQRLAAIAQPRPTDTPAMAALRTLLRDETYIAGIIADVQHWPPLTTEQRETLAALLQPQHHHR